MLSQISIVSFSIFYNEHEWHFMLSNFLIPYLTLLREKKMLLTYLISISDDDNKYLSLFIWTNEPYIFEIKSKRLLRIWMKQHPSAKKQDDRLVKLWMNFDNNSLHTSILSFDMHSFDVQGNLFIENSAVTEQVVSFILSNPSFDTEDLLTNILILGLVSIRTSFTQNLAFSIDHLIQHLSNSNEVHANGTQYMQHIVEEFEQNVDLLQDYYDDMIVDISSMGVAIVKWDKYMKNVYIDSKLNTEEVTVNNLQIICRAFGISSKKQIYVLTFLKLFIIKNL